MQFQRAITRLATLVCALWLGACGEGDGSGNSSRIEGTTATDAPLAQASITVRCIGGTTTTNAQGAYAVTIPANAALPCAVQVRAGIVGLQADKPDLLPSTESQIVVIVSNANHALTFAAFLKSADAAEKLRAGPAATPWTSTETELPTVGLSARAVANLGASAGPPSHTYSPATAYQHDESLGSWPSRMSHLGSQRRIASQPWHSAA